MSRIIIFIFIIFTGLIACVVHYINNPMPVIITKELKHHKGLIQYEFTYGEKRDSIWTSDTFNVGDTLK